MKYELFDITCLNSRYGFSGIVQRFPFDGLVITSKTNLVVRLQK